MALEEKFRFAIDSNGEKKEFYLRASFFKTLPLSAAELKECAKSTASDTARQIAKKVFGSRTMREAGCASHLDQDLIREILSMSNPPRRFFF